MKEIQKFQSNLVDIFSRRIYPAEISVQAGKILAIRELATKTETYILPGFIDSHVHIESSMLTPQHFGRIAISHGTVATVSDPHEIANVLGLDGVQFMIDNAKESKMKFFFGAPSCVPATGFESSGAVLSPKEIEYLFKKYDLLFLSEVMNYPGVIFDDPEVHEKIRIAKEYNKKIDGHAPGLTGEELDKYVNSGITTDHECSVLSEAIEKIEKGMMIQIREGSAAKNFEELWPLIDKYPDKVLLCCDDLHPDDLIKGHINKILEKAVLKGVDLFNLLRTVTLNPVFHYSLHVGLLKPGDNADFIIVDNLRKFEVLKTIINGEIVFDKNFGLEELASQKIINNFNAEVINPEDLKVYPQTKKIKVIDVKDGELLTSSITTEMEISDDDVLSDVDKDVLKIVVLNRYSFSKPAIGFIHNFGLKKGAIASSIAHDSHNLIAVGVNNQEIAECLNWIILNQGGIALHDGNTLSGIPLPIGGIISDLKAETVAQKYQSLNLSAKECGCKLNSPFMTLSFMALLVIPELKLSDKGLFDGKTFSFTSLFV